MPALPKIPKGFITNFPHAVPDFIGPRQFIFLLAATAIIILVTSFILIDIGRLKPSPFPEADLVFSSSSLETKYLFYLNSAKSTSNPGQAAIYYQKAFFAVSADYNRNPSGQKREFLENLAAFIKTNFPQNTQYMYFDIPCREESCGAVFNYSKGLTELKSEVADSENLSPELKQAVLINLEDAASAAGKKDTQWQFNALTSVFTTLRTEWQRTENSDTKLLAEKTLAIVKEVAPDQVSEEAELFKL